LNVLNKPDFTIGGTTILPGQRVTLELNVARLYTHASMMMPVHVIYGKKPGPRLFISAAIHGDEINGVEIIRRVVKHPALKRLRGILIAVPVVNVHGFIHHSRYLPDRRDLNRTFPGSDTGSLTARLAHLFTEEIVQNATHGIDLHTGAIHRINLPQIRADLDDEETNRLAHVFGVPVLINAAGRDGSLRQFAVERGIPMLLYEAGEALRFDEISIRAGVRGILEVMRALEMLPAGRHKRRPPVEPFIARSSTWVRAPDSGIIRATQALGTRVRKGDLLGIVADPFGDKEILVNAPTNGIIIGRTNLPLVNEGDALFHIGRFEKPGEVAERVEEFQSEHQEIYPEPEVEPPNV
jgi:predicted deacylase